jgi:uncharacterized protein YaeQ
VIEIPASAIEAVSARSERNMRIDCTIQDGALYLSQGGETLHFEPAILQAPE